MAETEAPENPQCRPPSMPTQPRAKAPGAPRRCSSLLCECGPAGREGRGWEGGQDGCRQHLQHLLICITADTLLDQENGARNNKGGGDSLRGPLRFSFLASNAPGAEGKRAAPQPAPGEGNAPTVAPDPQPCPFPSWEPIPPTLPSSGNPLPGAPLTPSLTPALPSWGLVLSRPSCLHLQTRHFPGQGPNSPCQPGSCSREHSA